MNKNIKRTIMRLTVILLYFLLIVLLYNVGKGHTIYIFNQKFIASDGTEIEAMYTCKILNAVEKSSFAKFSNLISMTLFKKEIYPDRIMTFHKGVPGQIVVPWHKKLVVFEFYDGKNLVKKVEKEVNLDPSITQYIWNLSALYENNSEWSGRYLIEASTDSKILKGK